MSVLAQVRYVEEFIADFARRKSVLVPTVRGDSLDKGGSTVFLVAGDGGRTAVTRGSNGLIPPSDDSQTQITCTLAEDHDLNEKTGFDIFKSQGNQAAIMRMNSMAVIHRKQDARIITALETGTVTLGAVGAISKNTANRVTAILGNADVGMDDGGNNVFCIVTPAAWTYLTDITSFANADYVSFSGETPAMAGVPQIGQWKHWMGVNWSQHGGLTGKGTSSATCIAYHKNAVGYAQSTMGLDVEADYDRKQQTSWSRASIFHGAVKLQNSGIVKFTHDDSGVSS
jgi:hypothetical protein